MTNNNQPLKGLQGETYYNVRAKAKEILYKQVPVSKKYYNITATVWSDNPVIDAMIEFANWQSQQPTEKESATVDEMAERLKIPDETPSIFAKIFDEYDTKGKSLSENIIGLMQAAYNMRDKEQAGAVELIEARIKELELIPLQSAMREFTDHAILEFMDIVKILKNGKED